MKIHESAVDYSEAILKLQENHGMVRSIDIARELGFSKPSISVAMKNLRENGHIQMDGDGYITLLPPGEKIAQRIYGRHKLLTQIFILKQVQEVLGHEDISTTGNVYAHLMGADRKATSEIMDGVLRNSVFCSEKCSDPVEA